MNKLPKSLNGIQYIPEYKDWQVVSTTSRFDNGTMRVIYGNDTPIQAMKQNRITPWPNGSPLVKVVWDKLEDDQGNLTPGKFLNVQYMIKDDKKFKVTEGWVLPVLILLS